MNPIYRFELSKNGANTRAAKPNYNNDLAIEYALEQNEEFYRGKLSGKLTFQKGDYAYIKMAAFDTQFDVEIFISYNGVQTWASYWKGKFFKTDCEFNDDDQTAIVTPTLNDRYNDVLAGLDKEYNLIDLSPVIQQIKLDKRPMIQVYVPGQTVIGCFLSGMWELYVSSQGEEEFRECLFFDLPDGSRMAAIISPWGNMGFIVA